MTDNDASRERGPDAGEHVGERLDAYRTGELDAETRRRVEAHLEACGRCRQELAALGAWAAAIERGYETRRADAAALAPDWAAQRSAIVARTSRRNVAERRWAFGRWAPQIALVALAALIVGIVWRENPREQPALTRTADTAPAAEESGRESDADEARSRRADAPPPTDAPAAAVPPPAVSPDRARENARELEKQDAREQAEDMQERREAPAGREALADRVAEPSPAAPLEDSLADVARFEREGRAALEARDTSAARRALSLWSDTLLPSGGVLGGQRVSLADSLREFLERAE